MLDVKITGGTLLDGTGRPGYRAEIGIRDGIITVSYTHLTLPTIA